MSEVVFHIGFPKTGTTTLQMTFARLPSVRYFGKNMRDAVPGTPDERVAPSVLLAKRLLCADGPRFAEALPEMRAGFESALAAGQSVFLSDEAFTFAEYMPVGRTYGVQAVTDHAAVAERLGRLWPSAHVVVVLREQADFLLAWYLQRAKRGFRDGSPGAFLRAAKATVDTRSLLNALRYDEMFTAYAGVFGRERLHVTLFEAIRTDYGALVREVARTAGIAEPEAVAAWGNAHNNTRDAIHPRFRTMLALVPGLKAHTPPALIDFARAVAPKARSEAAFTEEELRFVRSFYAVPNARMAALSGLELGAHGYAVATAGAAPPAPPRADAPEAPGATV